MRLKCEMSAADDRLTWAANVEKVNQRSITWT